MKRLMWLFGSATFVSAAAYSVVSLNRWEWTRALYFGLVMLVAEVGLATGLVLRKLDRRPPVDPALDRELRESLRRTRATHHRFAWLDPRELSSRTGVFITMLVGGGVVLSGLAWLVDRIAAGTVSPVLEGKLARQLAAIAYPPNGVLLDEVAALAQSMPHYDDPAIEKLLRRSG